MCCQCVIVFGLIVAWWLGLGLTIKAVAMHACSLTSLQQMDCCEVGSGLSQWDVITTKQLYHMDREFLYV